MRIKSSLLIVVIITMFGCKEVKARDRYHKVRDIDRAIAITDIISRVIFPTQTVVINPQPIYSVPVYQIPTYVTEVRTVPIIYPVGRCGTSYNYPYYNHSHRSTPTYRRNYSPVRVVPARRDSNYNSNHRSRRRK